MPRTLRGAHHIITSAGVFEGRGSTLPTDVHAKVKPYKGLIGGKTVVVVAARGDSGYGLEGPNWSKNHLEPYVADVFRFLGVASIKTVAVENDERGGLSLRQSLSAAEATLRNLAAEIGDGA